MQETKYYCDRCHTEITEEQYDKGFVQLWNRDQSKWKQSQYCETCDESIREHIAPFTKEQKKDKTNT